MISKHVPCEPGHDDYARLAAYIADAGHDGDRTSRHCGVLLAKRARESKRVLAFVHAFHALLRLHPVPNRTRKAGESDFLRRNIALGAGA